MRDFLYCGIYFTATGIAGFLIGRLLPKKWFCYHVFPYRCRAWEQGGRIYERIRIKDWMNRVPDMSKIFPFMPKKKLPAKPTQEQLTVMLRETCVAECIHGALNVTGLGCFWIWESHWCILFYAVYVLLGNLPFMLIQRYNRPRLLRLLNKRSAKCVY